MKKIITTLLLSLSLTGCAAIHSKYTQQIVIVAPAPHVHAPPIAPLHPAQVTWKVYNNNDLLALVQNANKSGTQVVLFTLDELNFKLLNSNLADINRYVKDQKAAITFLDKAANAPADAADAAAAAAPKDGKK